MNKVTGSNQLNIPGLISKFGKTVLSCTGCGTGTCDRTIQFVEANQIPSHHSKIGLGLESILGYLV